MSAARVVPPWLALAALAGAALVLLFVALSRAGRRRARPVVDLREARPCPDRPARGTRAEEVLALFGDLRAGSRVDRWRIVTIYEEDRGCVPVLLAGPDGREFRIDVLRRDAEGPPPPAETEQLGLYLAGMRPGSITPEDCHRGAIALAAALGTRAEPPAWLLTMREREALQRGAPRTG